MDATGSCRFTSPRCMQWQPLALPLRRIGYSVSQTVKPLLKELKELPMRIAASESVKKAAISVLDTVVDSTFKFTDQPLIVQGNFAPVEEIGDAVVVTDLQGQVPADFPIGVYIRNGPNPAFPEKTAAVSLFGKTTMSWFQGDGMLHATYFDKDERGNWVVSYKNKYVQAECFLLETERNKPLFLPSLEGDSQAVIASFLLNTLRFGRPIKDFSNTNVFEHAGRVFSTAENYKPHEIDVSTLDTLNCWDVNGGWARPFTSHPKKVPGTGELVIMGVDGMKPYYVLGVIAANGEKVVHKVDINLEKSILSHEVCVTENFNLIMDYPLTIDFGTFIRSGQAVKFEGDRRARIGVMPRYGDAASVAWFDVQVNCTLHAVNSYEEGDEVVLVGCKATGAIIAGPENGISKMEWFRRALRPGRPEREGFDATVDGAVYPRPYEWRLNMRTGQVSEGYLVGSDFAMDFPTINEQFRGLKNKFAYFQVLDSETSSESGMTLFNMLAKLHLDVHDHTTLHEEGEKRARIEYHVLEANQFCSGIQFVAKPEGVDEEDGWLITYVHNEETNLSQVYIIDAKRFTEKPVVKLNLPQRVPYGFHGTYIAKETLGSRFV